MITKEDILESITGALLSDNPTHAINIPIGWIFQAMQQYAEEYHRTELLKLNKSDVISSVCNHRFVRTTKNYKPAKKCVECGYVVQTDL